MERLRTKLPSTKTSGLSREAKKLLRLYAEGLSNWQQPSTPSGVIYREALDYYGPEFMRLEGPSSRTIYTLQFFSGFRGGAGSEKARDSVAEYWILARQIAPKAVEELLSRDEEGKQFLELVDKVLAKSSSLARSKM